MGLQGALQTGLMLEVCARGMGPCLCRRILGAHTGTYRVHTNLGITGPCAHGFEMWYRCISGLGPFTKRDIYMYLYLYAYIYMYIYVYMYVYTYIYI